MIKYFEFFPKARQKKTWESAFSIIIIITIINSNMIKAILAAAEVIVLSSSSTKSTKYRSIFLQQHRNTNIYV